MKIAKEKCEKQLVKIEKQNNQIEDLIVNIAFIINLITWSKLG